MAEISPAGWQEIGSNHARQGRLIAANNKSAGVWGAIAEAEPHLMVTGVGSANVTVAAGGAYVDAGTGQGLYACYNDADVTIPIPAQGATGPRTDLIVARVYDTNFGDTGPDRWVLERVDGTGTAPLPPAAPTRSLILAQVTVNANGTTIASISDQRQPFVDSNGTMIVRNTVGNTTSNMTEWQDSLGNVVASIDAQGNLSANILSAGNLIPPGVSWEYHGTVLPTGWLWQDGAEVSRTTYADLYTALGGASSPHGQGDGSTTFNVPDRRGRTGVGAGTGAGLTARALGAKGGSEDAIVVLHSHSHAHGASTGTESANHAHSGTTGGESNDHAHPVAADVGGLGGGGSLQRRGGPESGSFSGGRTSGHVHAFGTSIENAAHTHAVSVGTDATQAGSSGVGKNMQPFIVCNYIIKF